MLRVRGWLSVALVVSGLQSLQGCSEGGKSGTAVQLGKVCFSDGECPGGYCLDSTCSKPCQTDAECAAQSGYQPLTCGVDSSGRRSCVPECAPYRGAYACVDGVSTSCKVAPDTSCETCGCPSAELCEPGQGCVPKRAVGEPCESDDDCNTDNCSGFAGVCRVPIGAPCDSANCDGCLVADGWSYCSRECSYRSQCGSGLCLGRPGDYYCRPPCASFNDQSCPGNECELFIDDQTGRQDYHCDCANSGDCKWTAEKRALGARCQSAFDCVSELCESVIVQFDSFYGNVTQGLCTQPCAASSECGEGFACAAVDSPHCLPTCTERCSLGECVALPTAEGDSASVCWVKRSMGQCWSPSDCQSGNCVAGSCAPAGGQPNGAGCDGADDCQSKSCIGGKCRGTAVLGEACTSPADCAVGTCCSSGELASTCSTSCE